MIGRIWEEGAEAEDHAEHHNWTDFKPKNTNKPVSLQETSYYTLSTFNRVSWIKAADVTARDFCLSKSLLFDLVSIDATKSMYT